MSARGCAERGDPSVESSSIPQPAVGEERPLASGTIEVWDGEEWQVAYTPPITVPPPLARSRKPRVVPKG